MDKLPERSVDLIAELANEYLQWKPSLDTPDREIWWKRGQQDLIEILLAMKAQAEKRQRRKPDVSHINEDDTEGDDV